MILSYITYVNILHNEKPNSKMLKSVKHFVSSRNVRTFALPIGRKAVNIIQHIKTYNYEGNEF